MKLLFCKECNAVFSLTLKEKSCDCGKTKGRYTDTLNAVYQGPAMSLGFNNSSFINAMCLQALLNLKEENNTDAYSKGEEFIAFTIPVWTKTLKKIS